jgi:hypothetical protein
LAKLDAQISVLQERLTQLKLRQQRVDARKRAIQAERERKAEMRRRILVGTLVLAKVRDGGLDANVLRAWLDSGLTRTSDRALFDLPVIAGRDALESAPGAELGENL